MCWYHIISAMYDFCSILLISFQLIDITWIVYVFLISVESYVLSALSFGPFWTMTPNMYICYEDKCFQFIDIILFQPYMILVPAHWYPLSHVWFLFRFTVIIMYLAFCFVLSCFVFCFCLYQLNHICFLLLHVCPLLTYILLFWSCLLPSHRCGFVPINLPSVNMYMAFSQQISSLCGVPSILISIAVFHITWHQYIPNLVLLMVSSPLIHGQSSLFFLVFLN